MYIESYLFVALYFQKTTNQMRRFYKVFHIDKNKLVNIKKKTFQPD